MTVTDVSTTCVVIIPNSQSELLVIDLTGQLRRHVTEVAQAQFLYFLQYE